MRDPDGLAMSSRNARLQRPRARARARAASRTARRERARRYPASAKRKRCIGAAREQMAELDVEPEYLELVDPRTLEPLQTLDRSALLLVAARLGETRLIDNAILEPARAVALLPTQRKEPALCSA